MHFLTGTFLARGQFILNLACFLIAFIGDDIRYCANVVFTAGAEVVPNRVRQVNRAMFADQVFKE